ncbi:HupE/UreJ family protein [Oxalobacteraceae bacterium A2-2]
MNKTTITGAVALTLAAASLPLYAHTGQGLPHAHGFLDGFAHPFTGLDHLLAMLAVGVWSARQAAGKALPLTFLGMLLVGVLSGVMGLAIPGLETGIALTVALLGCLIAAAVRLPAGAGMAMVGMFAVLHGNAHGHELPSAAASLGMLAASALLLGAGRVLGRASPALAVKLSGAAIAAAGVALVAAA